MIEPGKDRSERMDMLGKLILAKHGNGVRYTRFGSFFIERLRNV